MQRAKGEAPSFLEGAFLSGTGLLSLPNGIPGGFHTATGYEIGRENLPNSVLGQPSPPEKNIEPTAYRTPGSSAKSEAEIWRHARGGRCRDRSFFEGCA